MNDPAGACNPTGLVSANALVARSVVPTGPA